MKINEVFQAIQGEGPEMGQLVTFIRFSGCNLSCVFCDTKYHRSGENISTKELEKKVEGLPRHYVVTGGEPVLQEKQFKDFMWPRLETIIKGEDEEYKFSLETNGTIPTELPYDLVVVSPKKQSIVWKLNTCCNAPLRYYAKLPNVFFKFVYENKDDKWWESLITDLGVNKDRVYIMPEGATQKEQLAKMREVTEYCVSKGYNFSPRLHVLTYNKKRRV